MAVDVKTLRIGSHVEYEGKRVCVDEICTLRPKDTPIRLLVSCNGLVYGNPSIDEVEPIPITAELLKELGFEEDKTDIAKRVGGYYIYFHQINNLRWRVSLEEENCTNYGNTLCRYLHEAEAFLALHGVELINE